jgi:hypothetical protein
MDIRVTVEYNHNRTPVGHSRQQSVTTLRQERARRARSRAVYLLYPVATQSPATRCSITCQDGCHPRSPVAAATEQWRHDALGDAVPEATAVLQQ